jgi:hypothetical protein
MGPAFFRFDRGGTGHFRFIAVEGQMEMAEALIRKDSWAYIACRAHCRYGEREGRPFVEFTWRATTSATPRAAAAGRGSSRTARCTATFSFTSETTPASRQSVARRRPRPPVRGAVRPPGGSGDDPANPPSAKSPRRGDRVRAPAGPLRLPQRRVRLRRGSGSGRRRMAGPVVLSGARQNAGDTGPVEVAGGAPLVPDDFQEGPAFALAAGADPGRLHVQGHAFPGLIRGGNSDVADCAGGLSGRGGTQGAWRLARSAASSRQEAAGSPMRKRRNGETASGPEGPLARRENRRTGDTETRRQGEGETGRKGESDKGTEGQGPQDHSPQDH